MSVELEEADLPLTEAEEAPAAPEKRGASRRAAKGVGSALSPSKKKKNNKKKNQPGKYSQLVVETIRELGERNGSSLAKIYNEAKKVAWFDQQNGRTYLKYSIKALVQNDTLLQVKGTGANGSFKLNRKKLEGGEGGTGTTAHLKTVKKAAAAAVASTSRSRVEKKPVSKSKKPEKKSHKKGASSGGGSARKDKVKAKKAAKKSAASPSAKKVKKSAKPKALKSRKA